ncbi:putative Late embryogenesis abundant protein, LEA-14 [Medicago truncatula]|uniref:Late embryogenesis abundant hydroxyproline-rich glycoprotein, putative n=2 Tax=Medicago truncatula TaxID=3880 RepID=A0A072V156_MEDTR|nr:NDR1/HIN1-like protein 13 [Medicago truncatula]KEH35108.1 late embryogenesis abundant hydroxyproline-rich glycoprotein, putative [Medicago truncatula]RHN68846.1 putative Late embryogenesis abundant protein, LEA-14 [Medicago truncatula]
MADRVHPKSSPPSKSNTVPSSSPPPSGTYVIQLPKDQTYRIPPPENAQRYANYTRRKSRRCGCCCCLCWFIGILFTLIVLMAIAAGVFYLIVRPEAPKYAIDRVSVKGMNLTSLSTISPEFDVSVKADNGNKKIGIYYESDSSVEMFYRGVSLCKGVLPAFYQPSNNVTVFQTVLKGNGIELVRSDQRALVNAVTKGSVPLTLKLRAPVKIKVGSVKKTWKVRVKVDCDLTVDQLTAQAKIVDRDCSYGFDLGYENHYLDLGIWD